MSIWGLIPCPKYGRSEDSAEIARLEALRKSYEDAFSIDELHEMAISDNIAFTRGRAFWLANGGKKVW